MNLPAEVVASEPIVPRFVCGRCNRRHSTRTEIGRDHVQFARPSKKGA